MKFYKFYIFLFLPCVLLSQSDFDITGRVSMQVQNVTYDEESKIKPDSISADEYGKTTIVPGLQQSMNLALFGRMRNFEFTLLSDLKNNDWNELDFADVNSIDRLSLNIKLFDHELVLGDFYQSGSERFLQSREIRGLKYVARLDDALGGNTTINIEGLGGQTQKAFEVGDRLKGTYKQFETSGQYNRNLAAGDIQIGKHGLFDISLKYLFGEDDKSSIKESFNPALKNNLYGAESNIYFWKKQVRLFGDYFSSSKDTIDEGSVDDYTFNGGVDILINKFKFLVYYQRIGFDYYTMGYPYLENDKEGIKAIAGYNISDWLILNSDYEWYENNLNKNIYKPTTATNILNAGFTTLLKDYPEFTFNYGWRSDLGDKVLDKDSLELSTDKITQKIEAKIAYKINKSRFSLSTTFLNLDDNSLIGGSISSDSVLSSPLGTDQFISSFNFYSQASSYLFLSGGIVYSRLTLTNNQKNENFYIYETNRWDIVPRKLKLESTFTAILNNAENGGIQDYLSDYFQLNAQISFEYFFSDFVSFKLITGTDSRNFNYTTEEALQVIADSDYGPAYFNGNESYSSWIVGGELNWNF